MKSHSQHKSEARICRRGFQIGRRGLRSIVGMTNGISGASGDIPRPSILSAKTGRHHTMHIMHSSTAYTGTASSHSNQNPGPSLKCPQLSESCRDTQRLAQIALETAPKISLSVMWTGSSPPAVPFGGFPVIFDMLSMPVLTPSRFALRLRRWLPMFLMWIRSLPSSSCGVF